MEQTPDEIFEDANGDLAVGDLDSAVEKYRRCVQIAPDFFDGWHALGMALMKLGRFTEAIQAGKKAVELRPNDQIGWTSLSLFYNRAGNIKEAEAAGAKAKILGWGGKISKESNSEKGFARSEKVPLTSHVSLLTSHQILTRLSAGRIIGQLSGKLNALANSGMFEMGPLHR